ncbi:hypothetical protein BAE30_06290 [Acidithiobacillus caldus]|uniref:AAA family ATPase n=1 Tax=Acidithiobacillus caldus TaxID=33059 RepID=A0A1E7YWZ4_9PROT|nr:hypothetical protein BAE30_06290 [Acidithiobacillus caldus]
MTRPEPIAPEEVLPPKPPLFRSVGELLSQPLRVRWAIKGILEAETVCSLIAAPASGKSFLALDLLASIATGHPWHDHEVREQGPCLYLCGEGHGGIQRRLLAWALAHPEANLDHAPLYISERTITLDQSGAKAIADEIERLGIGPRWVAVDTLARHLLGDESSARDMAEFFAVIDDLRAQFHCGFLIVHHTARGTDRARGSTAILGAMDKELTVARAEDGSISLRATKVKDGQEWGPLWFKLNGVKVGFDTETQEDVWSAVLVPTDSPEDAPDENEEHVLVTLRGLYDRARENLAESGGKGAPRVSAAELKGAVRLPKTSFYRARKQLLEDGRLILEGAYVYLPEN